MHRLPILLSLLPILAALICRKFFADRILHVSSKETLRHDAQELVRKTLASIQHDGVELKIRKRSWSGSHIIQKRSLTLSPSTANGQSASEHGRAALDIGLFLLLLRSPEIVARRQWAIRFGHVFPIFTTIIAVFALLAAKLPAIWILAIIATSFGAASCAQVFTLMANLQAAELVTIVFKKKHTFPRKQDEDAVIKATKAWAWHGILPGLLSRII